MNIVTHIGSISDIAHILPICSWLHINKGEKITFIFPEQTSKIETIIPLLKLQKFTEDVILINFDYADGYKFDPKKYNQNLVYNECFNFNTPLKYFNNPTEFQASTLNLGVDKDFTLNLDLDFKYDADKFSITRGLVDVYPHYEIINDDGNLLDVLKDFAYSKERHVNFNHIAIYFSLTRIPFYLYMFKKENGYFINETVDNFWLHLSNAPILDVRDFNSQRKIISVYNKIYFK